MKSKTFVSLALGFFAVALLAFSLWASPQQSLNVPPAAAVDQASLAPADHAPMPLATSFAPSLVAIVRSSPGSLIALIAASALAVMLVHHRFSRRHGNLVTAINTLPANVGSSKMSRRYAATAAIALRYALVKKGADDEHATIVAAASDEPIGATTDEAAAAEDPINVELFGLNARTLPLVAKVAIGLGADVYSDGTGKVTVKPTAAGTYWKVGKAMTASGADNDPIEVLPIKPRKLIVVAALTQTSNATIAGLNSTAVNPTKADFDALLAEAGKLQADFYVLSAALSGDADVTVATT